MKLQGVGGWAKVRVGKGRNKEREGTLKEGFAVGKEMKRGGMEENKKGMEGNHSIMEVMIIIGGGCRRMEEQGGVGQGRWRGCCGGEVGGKGCRGMKRDGKG